MQITPIAINQLKNINNRISINNFSTRPSMNLANDTFVKSCSFGKAQKEDEKSFEKFEQWAKETEFTTYAPEIIAKTGRILGSGFDSKIYAIPRNNDWVIKQYNRSGMLNMQTEKPVVSKIDDISPDLNIGQFVASVRLPINDRLSQQFFVLKRQSGSSYGVSYTYRNDVNDSTSKVHLNSLRKLSELPQESFDKLIQDIDYVTQRGYKFDCSNPGNFLIDEETKSINFVNVEDRLGTMNTTQYGDVLFALLDGEFAVEFDKSSRTQSEKDAAVRLSQQICSKFMIAMIRKNVKFDFTNKFQDVFNSKAFENIIGTTNNDDKLIELGLC